MQPLTTHSPQSGPIVNRFPHPGRQLEQAYRELTLAINGTPEQRQALGPPTMLPRPWDPDSLTRAPMRRELWDWLEAFTIWLNTQYAWDVAGGVPDCWPQHPHLVRELAVLADQRRRAALALGSDPLEEWHRYALPAFTERMRQRIKDHCQDGHQPWPAKGRHTRHVADPATAARALAFERDVAAHQHPPPASDNNPGPWLHLVDGQRIDIQTGEIVDGQPPLR